MITHVVTFAWKDGTTPEAIDEITAGLRALPARIDALLDYRVGADLGLNPGNADFAVLATVADEAGLRAYVDHPEHQLVVAKIKAMTATRTAVQIAVH